MNTGARVGPPACAFDPDKLTVTLDLLITSRIEAISPAVSEIMTLIKKTSCAPEDDFAVETALLEALANAVLHGNRLDPGKTVRICCACQKDRGVIIIVKDEGEGFDATKVPSPLVGERIHSEHGRGIYLVNTLMDEVRFERGGREIHGWIGVALAHEGQLREIEPLIDKAGFDWTAIAPDTPDTMKATRARYNLRARFLSDSQVRAAWAFRIAYEVDNATLAQLKGHGIDLEAASRERHHQLPVPAVYVVVTNGLSQFAYVNPDYKVRLDPELLLAALQTVQK